MGKGRYRDMLQCLQARGTALGMCVGIGCEMGMMLSRLSAWRVRVRLLWGLTEFGPGLAVLYSEICKPSLFLTLKQPLPTKKRRHFKGLRNIHLS